MILREEVEEEETDNSTVQIVESRIRRTDDRDIVTVVEKKDFRVTGPKRKYDSDNDTLPYGYKKQRNSDK